MAYSPEYKIAVMASKIQGYSCVKGDFFIDLDKSFDYRNNYNALVNKSGLNKFVREFNKFSMTNTKTNFCRIIRTIDNIRDCSFTRSYGTSQRLLELETPQVLFVVSIFADIPREDIGWSYVEQAFITALTLFFGLSVKVPHSYEYLVQNYAVAKYDLITNISQHERVFTINMKTLIQSQIENITNEK